MEKLTATIIALNEERRLAACLESLRGVADEVVVVDSYSTDHTVAICHDYGCRVTQRHFDGFGAQRQYATSLASHRYILSIDADEVLSPALRESIIRLKEQGFAHRVYAISRLNFYCGYPVKHCGWYPDLQIRLFDKRVDGDILHYRCETREQFRDITRAHATIKARVLAVRPEPISSLEPMLHGLRAWWHTYISEGGILEGNAGREIAAESYRSEYLAYSAAKKLRK